MSDETVRGPVIRPRVPVPSSTADRREPPAGGRLADRRRLRLEPPASRVARRGDRPKHGIRIRPREPGRVDPERLRFRAPRAERLEDPPLDELLRGPASDRGFDDFLNVLRDLSRGRASRGEPALRVDLRGRPPAWSDLGEASEELLARFLERDAREEEQTARADRVSESGERGRDEKGGGWILWGEAVPRLASERLRFAEEADPAEEVRSALDLPEDPSEDRHEPIALLPG